MSNKSYNKIIPIITGIIGFFGGIALVNNWLVLNKAFPQSEYLKVPFTPDAWGNLADWTMVLVTSFTAYYLVKTFREQKNINRASLLPIFMIDQPPVWIEERGCAIMKLKIIKNTSFHITLISSYDGFLSDGAGFPTTRYLAQSECFEIECSGETPKALEPFVVELIKFSFKDVSDNTYFQKIIYHRWKEEYSLTVPELTEIIN